MMKRTRLKEQIAWRIVSVMLMAVMILTGVNLPALTMQVKAAEEEPEKVTQDGLIYQVDKDSKGSLEATLIGLDSSYFKPMDQIEIVIPETISYHWQGVTVRKIADEVFAGKSKIVSITMSDNIVEVGKYSFASCKDLETLKLSNKIPPMANKAFAFDLKLKSVNIPTSWTYISEGLFMGNESLEEITIPAYIKSIEKNAFNGTNLKKVYYGGTESEWIELMGKANTTEGNGLLVSPTISVELNVHQYTKYVTNGEGTHAVFCELCGILQEGHEKEACTGGEATCAFKAKCEKCRTAYGELIDHTYGAIEDVDEIFHGRKCEACYGIEAMNHVDIDEDEKCDVCSRDMPSKVGCYVIDFVNPPNPVDGLAPDFEIKDTNVEGRIVVCWMEMKGKAPCAMAGNEGFAAYVEDAMHISFEDYLEAKGLGQIEKFDESKNYQLMVILSDVKTPGYLYINGQLFAVDYVDGEMGITDTAKYVCAPHEHRYSEASFAWTGYANAKATLICDGDAAHTKILEATITSEVTKVATAKEEGIKTYTAKVAFEGKEYTDVKIESIPKLETKPSGDETPDVKPTDKPSGGDSAVTNQALQKQTITVSKKARKTVTYKATILKKKKVTLKLNAKAKTKLTYKVSKYPKNAKKYISVTKKGVITMKKGAKKGTYKVVITAKADSRYKKATKTITIKIK